jgi:hypothetical protein
MIGALKLIEFRGPERHVYGLEHLCFVTYRNYLVSLEPPGSQVSDIDTKTDYNGHSMSISNISCKRGVEDTTVVD